MMKASRPNPKRAPAAKKAAAQKKKHKIFKPRRTRRKVAARRASKRKRRDLLAARSERQKRFDAGELPDFPPETRHIRDNDSWRVAPIPVDLTDRRVEITGPVDRKMIVNALNSGATHYMADFEDANSPTWRTILRARST
jgi:malate synthase